MKKLFFAIITIILTLAAAAVSASPPAAPSVASASIEEYETDDGEASAVRNPKITSMSFWTQNPFYFTLLVLIIIAVASSYFSGLIAAGMRMSKNSRKNKRGKD